MVALLKMPRKIDLGQGGAERRMFPRKEVQLTVQGRRLDHAIPSLKMPQVSLTLRDLSMGGLSAISSAPLEAGERVNVSFPPEGLRGGWDVCGRILRCTPSALGFRVAVEFDPLPVAA